MKNILLALVLVSFGFGQSTLRAVGGDVGTNNIRIFKVDSATRAITTIMYEHHEIHGCSHYYLADTLLLGSGDSAWFALRTPNSTKYTHMTWKIEAQGTLDFRAYEGATITFNGTPFVPLNNKRMCTDTSSWLEKQRNPAITALGTRIFRKVSGSGTNPATKAGGSAERNNEIIFKPNTVYLFIFKSGVASNVISFDAEWYEHTDKN